jgi:hypothetical protein
VGFRALGISGNVATSERRRQRTQRGSRRDMRTPRPPGTRRGDALVSGHAPTAIVTDRTAWPDDIYLPLNETRRNLTCCPECPVCGAVARPFLKRGVGWLCLSHLQRVGQRVTGR